MPNMKTLMEILKKTLTLNSKDYDFIKNKIEYRPEGGIEVEETVSFASMMNFLFSWSGTKEGHAYWQNVIQREMKMQEDLLNHSHE